MVRVIVHEDDHTLACKNHGCESRPVVDTHGNFGWKVRIWHQPGLLNEWNIALDRIVATISEQEGHDVVGVRIDPFTDGGEVCCDRPCVEDIAGRVAEMRRAIFEVHLALEETDAIVQLGGDWQGLVGSCIAGDDEGRVVGCDFSDVAIFPRAEFGVVVAGRRVCGCG